MDLTTVESLISNVGFPIVCCLILCYVVYNMTKTHKEEIQQITTAIDNNTTILNKVLDALEKIGVDIENGN